MTAAVTAQPQLEVVHNDLVSCEGRHLLCISHSDRPTALEECDLNVLETRFARPDRLPPSEPFESLPPAAEFSPYRGTVSAYDVGEDGTSPPRLVCRLRPSGFKPQYALWCDGLLWVLGVEQLYAFDSGMRCVASVEDPWLAGGHTLAATDDGTLLVSCAASDSVLVVDRTACRVTAALRLPEALYGTNYDLARTDSVVDHFISNDLQIGHVNCAWPWRGGVLASALIPGAVGWFDPSGRYRELLRGFVGCHGIRVRADTSEPYFCDSCAGILVTLDPEMRITRRAATGSHWLHDAVHLGGELFALAVTDRNEVAFLDLGSREVVSTLSCEGMGGAPQFLSFGR